MPRGLWFGLEPPAFNITKSCKEENNMSEAVIVASVRSAGGRYKRGGLAATDRMHMEFR